MSKLEHVIDEIEDYLDSCKFQALSKSSIIVDKKILDGKLRELRNLIPDEIKKYQTIINNKDAILDDARQKAHTLIDDAQVRRNELINEHEVMRQAYEQAGEVVSGAAQKAQTLLDDAQTEANGMKEAAVRYTDSLLANVEKTLTASIRATESRMHELLKDYETLSDTVKKNREALTMPEASGSAPKKEAPKKEEVIPNTRIIRNDPPKRREVPQEAPKEEVIQEAVREASAGDAGESDKDRPAFRNKFKARA